MSPQPAHVNCWKWLKRKNKQSRAAKIPKKYCKLSQTGATCLNTQLPSTYIWMSLTLISSCPLYRLQQNSLPRPPLLKTSSCSPFPHPSSSRPPRVLSTLCYLSWINKMSPGFPARRKQQQHTSRATRQRGTQGPERCVTTWCMHAWCISCT